MALILSIETSTTVCSVALTEEGQDLETLKIFDEQSHSTHLTLLISEVLEKSGKAMSDISAVAVSEGPGSYTGLRIGVSTAKGLCYTLGIPLIAIPTLECMAYEAALLVKDKQALLVPMLDARRMEVYTATYSMSRELVKELRPLILDQDCFKETLITHKLFFFGNGSDKWKPQMLNEKKAHFIDDLTPSAWAVGQIAYKKFLAEEFANVAYFEPNYLKAYQATQPKKLL